MKDCFLTIEGGDGIRRIPFTPPVRLSDLLARQGVPLDMPCGGRQRCLKCKLTVTGSLSPLGERERALLTDADLRANRRYACMVDLTGDAHAVLPRKEGAAHILTEGAMPAFRHAPWAAGIGAAVDIGTTTVAAYLFDLQDGSLLATLSESNPQAVFGADVISRLEKAMAGQGAALAGAIRGCVARLLTGLCDKAARPPADMGGVVLTGNTAMLYLLCDASPASIVAAPFDMDRPFGRFVTPAALQLPLPPDCRVYLPRCLSAYVGADITTALLAAGFYKRDEGGEAFRVPDGPPRLLVDIGTNGEMALAANGGLLCCSTAAGPALEGAGIRQGMMAADGAIYRVRLEKEQILCGVLGGGEARGICGSGLIDAIAVLRAAGVVDETGVIHEADHPFTACMEEVDGQPAFRLPDTAVVLTQKDIRAVQLAKSAICAGMLTLLSEAGLSPADVAELVIAGGFGSRVDVANAQRIGLIPPGFADKARAVGNAAGAGAAMTLLSDDMRQAGEQMPAVTRTVELSSHPGFMDAYIDGMFFP